MPLSFCIVVINYCACFRQQKTLATLVRTWKTERTIEQAFLAAVGDTLREL